MAEESTPVPATSVTNEAVTLVTPAVEVEKVSVTDVAPREEIREEEV